MDSPALYEVTYVCEGVAGKSRRYTVLAVSIEDALLQCRKLLDDGNGSNGWRVAEARCLTAAQRVYVTGPAIRAMRGETRQIPGLSLLIDCVEFRLKKTRSNDLAGDLHALLESLHTMETAE